MNPMDTNEKFHVIDVRSEEELEVQCQFLKKKQTETVSIAKQTDRNCIHNKAKQNKTHKKGEKKAEIVHYNEIKKGKINDTEIFYGLKKFMDQTLFEIHQFVFCRLNNLLWIFEEADFSED